MGGWVQEWVGVNIFRTGSFSVAGGIFVGDQYSITCYDTCQIHLDCKL